MDLSERSIIGTCCKFSHSMSQVEKDPRSPPWQRTPRATAGRMVRPVSPELRDVRRQTSPGVRAAARSASPDSRGSQHCGAKMAMQIYAMRPPRNPEDGQFDASVGPSPASVARRFNITSKVQTQCLPVATMLAALTVLAVLSYLRAGYICSKRCIGPGRS
jgi:hypothetical protein